MCIRDRYSSAQNPRSERTHEFREKYIHCFIPTKTKTKPCFHNMNNTWMAVSEFMACPLLFLGWKYLLPYRPLVATPLATLQLLFQHSRFEIIAAVSSLLVKFYNDLRLRYFCIIVSYNYWFYLLHDLPFIVKDKILIIRSVLVSISLICKEQCVCVKIVFAKLWRLSTHGKLYSCFII